MARIKVAQPDGEVIVFDGDKQTVYKVEGGHVVVDDLHSVAVQNVDGHKLAPEAPAKKEK